MRSAKLWDIGTGKELKTLTLEEVPDVYSVVFSPDSKTLATAALFRYKGNGISLWDVATGKLLYTVRGESPSFSPDGKTLAGGWRGELKLWEAATGKEIRSFKGYVGSDYPLQYATLSPNGKVLAGNNKEGVTIWDVSEHRQAALHHQGEPTDNIQCQRQNLSDRDRHQERSHDQALGRGHW